MKLYLTAFALMFFTILSAQSKTTHSSVKKTDSVSIAKQKSLKWFKDIYVRENFKDPYSYKPLETKVYVITYEQKLKEELDELSEKIEFLGKLADTTSGLLPTYKSNARSSFSKIDDRLYASVSKEQLIKWYEDDLKLVEKERSNKLGIIDNLNKKKADYATLKNEIEDLNDKQKKLFGYYLVTHDCHATNSYGGQVLGKYAFKFTFDKLGYDVVKMN